MRKQAEMQLFQKRPVYLKIVLHYWEKQRAYWDKCPSSYIEII
jgi:hypothetical protein